MAKSKLQTAACRHLDQVREVEPRTPAGCEECLKTGGLWGHLRVCVTCGHVGCCDESPGWDATKLYRRSRHPLIRSFQPGEDWGWCYADRLLLEPAPSPP